MAIEFHCSACGQQLRVPDGTAGREAKCPSCSQLMAIPKSEPDELRLQPLPASTDANPYASPAPTAVPGNFGQPLGSEFSQRKPSASRGKRLGGAILDGLLQMVVCLPGIIFMVLMMDQQEMDAEDIEMLPLAVMGIGLLILGIFQMYLIATSGQSIGKKALGTRIVNYDGGANPGFVKAVIMRMWVPSLIGAVPNLGSCFSLINVLWIFGEERRCLHDLIAGTRVIDA